MAGYENFQVDRNKNKNAVGLYSKGINYNKNYKNMTKQERLMEGVGDWAAFYRIRPDIFVEEYLGIELKDFQKVELCIMMYNNYTIFWGSRGLGKSWLTALFCVVKAILYPGSKIIIASKTKEQAMNIVSEKIHELINMSSTGMLEREIDGVIKTNLNTPDPNVEFLNGSWVKVVPAHANARSKRGNLLILDEFVQINPDIYKKVLRRFLAVSRQPKFQTLEPYKSNLKQYMERNQEIFLSSCWFKFNWGYERHKTFINNMKKGSGYFVNGFPYQIAIKEGLVNPEQLKDELAEDDLDEVGWAMEMDTLFYGEDEKAYFKTEELNKIRYIKNPVYPKEFYDLFKSRDFKYIKKKKNEIRVLCADIAMVQGKKNDASAFTLMQLNPMSRKINGQDRLTGYSRRFSYMESSNGSHTEIQAIQIRRLFNDLDCDYIVLDRHGNGISVYDSLCKNLYDEDRGVEYEAICSMNEQNMKERCLVPDAPEIIYTISATQELNSIIALKFKDDIKKGKIEIPVNKNDGLGILNRINKFHNLPLEIQTKFISAYKQFDMLVNEMVLLEGERKPNGSLVLKEKGNERKDKYTSCSYGNYFGSILEKDLLRTNKKDECNMEDYLLFGW